MRIERPNQTHLQSKGANDKMTHAFDQVLLSSEFDKNVSNPTCEGYGCNNKAKNQITVNVGRLGNIDLNLCNNCTPIFKNTDKLTALEEQLTSDRMADPDDRLLSTT